MSFVSLAQQDAQRFAAHVIVAGVSAAGSSLDLERAFGAGTLAGQQEAARILSSYGGPEGAFLTALPGGHMTMDDIVFVVAVGHRLGICVPTDMPSAPCQCMRSAGAEVAAGADHATVCKKVAKMTKMLHDTP